MLDFTLSGKDYFDSLPQPVLLYGATIEYCNGAAQALFSGLGIPLEAGAPVPEPLPPAEQGPCALTVRLSSRSWAAVLRPLEGRTLCQLSPLPEETELEPLRHLAGELRTRFSNTALWLEQLQKELSELEQQRSREKVSSLNRSFHQLLRLMDHLDLYTRSEAELSTLYPSATVDLVSLCEEVSASVGPLTRQMGRQFSLECAPEPCLVQANRKLLFRLLCNLISNALEAGGDLNLRLTKQGDRALLTLRDTGGGIAPSVLSALFSPEQKEGRLTLGLSLCRRIAEFSGGQIMAVGGEADTAVSLSLPLCPEDETLHAEHMSVENGYSILLTELSDVLPPELYYVDDVF